MSQHVNSFKHRFQELKNKDFSDIPDDLQSDLKEIHDVITEIEAQNGTDTQPSILNLLFNEATVNSALNAIHTAINAILTINPHETNRQNIMAPHLKKLSPEIKKIFSHPLYLIYKQKKLFDDLNLTEEVVSAKIETIQKHEKDLEDIKSRSNALLTNINDLKLTSGYFERSSEWKIDETDYWANFRDTAWCALPILLLISWLLLSSNLSAVQKTTIILVSTGVITYVLSIFSSRYKHARYLRAHYEHLTIATTFYRNYIQDQDVADTDTKKLARENLLTIASLMPIDGANKESFTDKLIQERIDLLLNKTQSKKLNGR